MQYQNIGKEYINKMSKDKKEKVKSNKANQNPSINNDQLGENASEHMSEHYDNKTNKKKK